MPRHRPFPRPPLKHQERTRSLLPRSRSLILGHIQPPRLPAHAPKPTHQSRSHPISTLRPPNPSPDPRLPPSRPSRARIPDLNRLGFLATAKEAAPRPGPASHRATGRIPRPRQRRGRSDESGHVPAARAARAGETALSGRGLELRRISRSPGEDGDGRSHR